MESLKVYGSFLFQDIDDKTDSHTFRKKWGNDPRFEALDRKEREHLLNERCHFEFNWTFLNSLNFIFFVCDSHNHHPYHWITYLDF